MRLSSRLPRRKRRITNADIKPETLQALNVGGALPIIDPDDWKLQYASPELRARLLGEPQPVLPATRARKKVAAEKKL